MAFTPKCLDEPGESLFNEYNGLGIVHVWGREKGSLIQYKLHNPLTTAMDVHYVMAGDDLQAMRKAPRRAVHVPAGDCADVVQSPELPSRSRLSHLCYQLTL